MHSAFKKSAPFPSTDTAEPSKASIQTVEDALQPSNRVHPSPQTDTAEPSKASIQTVEDALRALKKSTPFPSRVLINFHRISFL